MRQHFVNFFNIIGLGLLLNTNQAWAQPAQTVSDSLEPAPLIDYSEPRTYEIGGIEVKGATYTDANGIIAISGLSVGKKLPIPSDQVSKAIRKLWKQGLFVDVEILIQKNNWRHCFF